MLLIKPEATRPGLWQAMVTPIKRLKPGEKLTVDTASGAEYELLIADIITAEDGFKRLLVDLGPGSNVFNLLNEIGMAPLPPYILREKPTHEDDGDNSGVADVDGGVDLAGGVDGVGDGFDGVGVADASSGNVHKLRSYDLERYQTVFATNPGAVAAPTAGLHFSQEMLKKLEEDGIIVKRVTLHVGPGTFKPVELDVDSHYIEPEVFFVPQETVEAVTLAKKEKRRVIAVGTTSLRALESAATDDGVRKVDGESTSLYVKPGFKFRVVDALITNFHLSKSSLLVLVSTFAGHEIIRQAYEAAIAENYRFYSYGDAMFIHH